MTPCHKFSTQKNLVKISTKITGLQGAAPPWTFHQFALLRKHERDRSGKLQIFILVERKTPNLIRACQLVKHRIILAVADHYQCLHSSKYPLLRKSLIQPFALRICGRKANVPLTLTCAQIDSNRAFNSDAITLLECNTPLNHDWTYL